MTDIIEQAEAALEGTGIPPWSVNGEDEAQETDDYDDDSWCDVDGPNGGWVAHCQDVSTAQFVAWARTGVLDLIAELKAVLAENERLQLDVDYWHREAEDGR